MTFIPQKDQKSRRENQEKAQEERLAQELAHQAAQEGDLQEEPPADPQ